MPVKKTPPIDDSADQKLKLQWKEIQMMKHQEYTNFKVAKEVTMSKVQKDEVPETYSSQTMKQNGKQTFTINNNNNNGSTIINSRYTSNQNCRSHGRNTEADLD